MEAGEDEMLAIRVMAMPRDTNAHGTIFGGLILSLVDQAGAIVAQLRGARKVVTVSMREVSFESPVRVGDVISCYANVAKRGRTSMTVAVRVTARSPIEAGRRTAERSVTRAEVVYVQVDSAGKPLPFEAHADDRAGP